MAWNKAGNGRAVCIKRVRDTDVIHHSKYNSVNLKVYQHYSQLYNDNAKKKNGRKRGRIQKRSLFSRVLAANYLFYSIRL